MGLISNLFSGPRTKGLKLLEAVFSKNLQAAESLVKNGADLNIKEKYYNGETAIFMATRFCYEPIVRMLIERGADVNVKNNSGETPLSVALVSGKINKLYLRIAMLLIENGADSKERDHYLSMAAANNHGEIVRLLIERGADVNAVNFGESILCSALKMGHLDVARILIEKGAHVNMKTKEGETPLLIASAKGSIGDAKKLPYIDIVQLLLEKGANINARGNNGVTALSMALGNGHLDIARLLIDKGADLNVGGALISVIDQPKIVQLLIEKGIDLTTEAAGTALNAAIIHNHRNVALLLIDNGVNVNAIHRDYDMEYDKAVYTYSLHLALGRHLHEIVIRLIERGADVNARNYVGYTALHTLACNWDYEGTSSKIAKLLLEKGADVNARAEGLTALEIARRRGYTELVQILENAGSEG